MSGTGTFRWAEAASWLFRLHGLTQDQLARVATPPCSPETARRALVALERRGLTRRRAVIPPWRTPPQGRPLTVHVLTAKGIEGGGFLAGLEETSAKRLRALHGRGFSEWKLGHNLLRNSWLCEAVSEAIADPGGLILEEACGEHGAVMRAGRGLASAEADGLLDLSWAGDPAWRLAAYLEADTGSQNRGEIRRKASRYLSCFDEIAHPEDETGTWPPMPLMLIFSPSAARSERVARWVAEAAKAEGAGAARSLSEKGIDPGELMLVACLEWVQSEGALGDSCLAALSGERRSVLGAPYARPGLSQFVPDGDA